MKDLASTAVGILVASAIVVTLLGFYWYRRQPSFRTRIFLFACLAVAIYNTGYAMEISSANLPQALFWNKVQYIGTPVISPLWALFALASVGKYRGLKHYMWILLFAIPVMTTIIQWTPSLSRFNYVDVELQFDGSLAILVAGCGPWYIVQFMHMSAGILCACYYYLNAALASRSQRFECLVLAVATLLPWASAWLLVFGLRPLGLDTVPFALFVSIILVSLMLFRSQFNTLMPLAYHHVFEWMKEGIIIMDRQGQVMDYNAAAVAILPNLNPDAIGMAAQEALAAYPELVQSVVQRRDGQVVIKSNAERDRYYQTKIVSLSGSKGFEVGYMLTLNDVTEQVETLQQMETLALFDPLTGVANRRHALHLIGLKIAAARRDNEPFSLLMLDVDHFKVVNDAHGHMVGDAVLKHLASICATHIRDGDVLGRYGGEEFIIGLPRTRPDDAARIAERLRAAVNANPAVVGDLSIPCTVSIGIGGVSCVTGQTADHFLRSADQAMYKAKSAGRDSVVVAEG